VVTTVQTKLRGVEISPEDFGAVGDGTADDTTAVIAAFTYANTFVFDGLASTIHHPGAEVVLRGKYKLTSLASAISIKCNVKSKGASFIVPAAYASEVVRIGYDSVGDLLSTANIELPDIYKAAISAVAGSVGVRVANLNTSRVWFGRTTSFETGLLFGGIGQGCVYNDFYLNHLSYCTKLISIIPGTAGWANDNNFYKGNLYQGGGHRVSGNYQVYIDGTNSTVASNNFWGISLEGDGSEYLVYVKKAGNNTFWGAHHESGFAALDVTVSGATLTDVAHGLAVGDMLMLYATVLPTGMYDLQAYYVIATPTADTFTIGLDKNGSAITFSSAGTAVKYIVQNRVLFDGAGSVQTYDNTFVNLFTPPSNTLQVIESGSTAYNNAVIADGKLYKASATNNSDIPPFQGVNTSSSSLRPVFAAYENTTDPTEDPTYWKTAISPRGVLFASSGAELARLFNSAGNAFWSVAGGSSYQIGLPLRSGILNVTALAVPANGRATTTGTLTGAAVGDFVSVTPYNAWPDGIALAWARVSAADTVQLCFHNWTGSLINLTTDYKLFVTKA
jgi:hypothetical protein